MMDIEKISMPADKAKEEWKKYNQLIKTRHDNYLKDMKKCTFELKQGRELIDIYKVIEKAGINKEFHPRLAIARADWRTVQFVKRDPGRGIYSKTGHEWASRKDGDIDLQPHTLNEWAREHQERTEQNSTKKVQVEMWQIANPNIKTKVPLIPAQLTPEGELSGYYILWEVEHWEQLPKKDDPILLKRITENLFVILGAWDVTDLEQSVISGQ